MRKILSCILTATTAALIAMSGTATAQTVDIFRPIKKVTAPVKRDTMVILPWFDEELAGDVCLIDSANIEPDTVITDPLRPIATLPVASYGPIIFNSWEFLDTLEMIPVNRPAAVGNAFDWIDDINAQTLMLRRAQQEYVSNNPGKIRWNARNLPEPPAQYNAYVDPVTTRIVIEERKLGDHSAQVNELLDVKPIDWIQSFNASLQFSQAYVSPNWYQGGNRSLLALLNVVYNVKLNQKLHPKLLFETTVAYKLGINSAPDDTVRSYNMSEDLFQINSTFGYKAVRRWYYSANLQFKTQMFRSHQSNSDKPRAAFLSPGELNVGLGMTYEYTNKRKTFNFNASISPLSWQMRTCINNQIDETAYDIKPGRNVVNKIGSSAEYFMNWKVTYNIAYTSRMFLFTDYERFQGDWEHTIAFNINKYLSTQIYAHMRYDTTTPRVKESWHKFQFKEIFSLGFTYKFANT